MKKENEQLESHPEEQPKQQAFDDQRVKNGRESEEAEDETGDEEEDDDDDTPDLDEADLEENNLSDEEADKIEWGPEGKKGGKQDITNTADRGTDNKGTDDDNRTGSNTMRTQDQPLK